MKQCPGCMVVKSLDDFGRRWPRTEKQTRRSYCRDCEAARSRRFARQDGYAAQRRWVERNKDRITSDRSARNKATYALKKGLLVRPNVCEACGKTAYTEAAHDDYSRPLDVSWWCRRCHRESDHRDPKTIRPAGPDTREAAQAAA